MTIDLLAAKLDVVENMLIVLVQNHMKDLNLIKSSLEIDPISTMEIIEELYLKNGALNNVVATIVQLQL